MNDFFTIASGCLGMLIAVVHGYLGATKVIHPIKTIHPTAKRILHGVFLLSAIYWFIGGALLVAAPFYLTANAVYIAVWLVGLLYLSGAVANFWATRGRHFGWVLLSVATALAWVGLWVKF